MNSIDIDELESNVASVLAAITKHDLKAKLPIDAENLLRDLEEKVGEFLDAVPFESVEYEEPPPAQAGPKLSIVGRGASS